jgi:hypothetical protein
MKPRMQARYSERHDPVSDHIALSGGEPDFHPVALFRHSHYIARQTGWPRSLVAVPVKLAF